MATFMLIHRHDQAGCPAAYAAWNGFDSSLRRQQAYASCGRITPVPGAASDHQIWWIVEAADASAALAQLPLHVAEHAEAVEVSAIVTADQLGIEGSRNA